MKIFDFNENFLDDAEYQSLIGESFFPNEKNSKYTPLMFEYLKKIIPINDLSFQPISGEFSDSIEAHTDDDIEYSNEKYSIAFIDPMDGILQFFADNTWVEIRGKVIVIFSHRMLHAIIRNRIFGNYRWMAWFLNIKESYVHSEQISSCNVFKLS